MSDTHQCPGGCGVEVGRARLACPRCWSALPADLASALSRAYRARAVRPAEHRAALKAALDWYRGRGGARPC